MQAIYNIPFLENDLQNAASSLFFRIPASPNEKYMLSNQRDGSDGHDTDVIFIKYILVIISNLLANIIFSLRHLALGHHSEIANVIFDIKGVNIFGGIKKKVLVCFSKL